MNTSLAAGLPQPTPFQRFVITGFWPRPGRQVEVAGWARDHEVALRYDEARGQLLIEDGERVRAPRYDELRDLRRVFDAWVAKAQTVPALIERVRVGIAELLFGPARLERFHVRQLERVGTCLGLSGPVGDRGRAVISLELSSGALTLRYEAVEGVPSRERSLKPQELSGLVVALDRQAMPGTAEVRAAAMAALQAAPGFDGEPVLAIGEGAPV